MGKENIQIKLFFFLSTKFIFNLRVLPIEFNSHKFSFVRFVFVEISGLFLVDPKDPEMTQKFENFQFFFQFKAVSVNFLIDIENKNFENVQRDTNSLSNSLSSVKR